MKITTICLLLAMLVGCTTQRKASDWFDQHPEQDAQRCAVKYPARDSVHVTIDTAGAAEEVHTLMVYSDSITQVADARNKAIAAMKHTIDSLAEAGAYSESVAKQLADEANNVTPVDVPALTRSIEAKVRATIKPCHDSLVIRVDSAQHMADILHIRRLQQDSTNLVQMKSDKKNPGIVSGWLLTSLLGKWWFWVILAVLASFLTRKLWAPFLT